ncbi:MAG: hypothetical protein RR865_01660 [Clostridia bacterium]
MAKQQKNKTKKFFKFLDKAGDFVNKYALPATAGIISLITLSKVSKKS